MNIALRYYHYSLAAILTGLSIGLLYLALFVMSRLVRWRVLAGRKITVFELTPPAAIASTPQATQELFTVLHGLRASRSPLRKLLGLDVVLTFEIHSTRAAGIRYLVHTDGRSAGSFAQVVHAYLPQMKITEVPNEQLAPSRIATFKQTGHYAFPLAMASSFEEHDPIAYLTNAMTGLLPGETICLQLVVTPVRLPEAANLARRILRNEDLLVQLSTRQMPLLSTFGKLMSSTLFAATDVIGEAYHTTATPAYSTSYGSARQSYEKMQVNTRKRPARAISSFEQQLMETMHQKLNQPQFRVSLRAIVTMDTPQASRAKLAAIKTALQGYSVPSYQSLQTKPNNPLTQKLRRYQAEHRLPTIFYRGNSVLASSELACLFHFPLGSTAQTDNLITSLSHTLPAPVSLKQNAQLDVMIGENVHHGITTPIGLTEKERERHQYIIGGTGNGKTTMLQYQIIQDMQNGKGVAIVDPHGDMAETLLRHTPKERIKDVIYFNPDDLEYPVGLNLLELTPGLSGNELLREKDIITESVVSVFRKIFSDDDSGGHRIEYVLRNTIHTALTIEHATLFTILKLLQNAPYRKGIIAQLQDEDLKDFWNNELGQAGNMQRVKMSAGITAKIGRFNANAAAKLILGQQTSTVDFEDIINSGKILICNFSKGLLGEDVSELFGITVLAKLQLASLRRARVRQQERRSFYLYVDEFQNFATPSFVQLLSEARKYRMFLTMAEQSTSQQDDQKMVSIILANVGTVICFRTGNPQDEWLLLPLFSPYVEPGEIANLSAFNFYAKLSSVQAQEPLSGQTLLLSGDGSNSVSESVIANSRLTYTGKPELQATKTNPAPETQSKSKSKSRQQETSSTVTKKVRLPGEPKN